MTRRFSSFVVCPFICVSVVGVAAGQSLQPVIFTIDPGSTISVAFSGATGQGPNGEGAVSPVEGHFMVEFDPLDLTPDTIAFQLGHGFLDAQVTGNWLPGTQGATDVPAPADIGIQNGFIKNSIRDLVWDWTSAPVANSGSNTYSASATQFEVLSMLDHISIAGPSDETGFSDSLSSGDWNLSQAGNTWQLGLEGTYADSAGRVFGFSIQTSAEFSAANLSEVLPEVGTGNAVGEALGGSGGATPGGVSVAFEGVVADATFSVQQLPNSTGFSQAAIDAIEDDALFSLSTNDPAVQDQIWELSLVDAAGDDVDFAVATLQFQYDDSVFAPGFNETQLGLWHFNSNLNEWESFNILDGTTTIDTDANVITVELSSFSEVQLGVFAVPEPSTFALASIGLVAFGIAVRRRRRVA